MYRCTELMNTFRLSLTYFMPRLEGDVELEVSYQPHFNTITKTGDANFSKIPHAVAELIDNSIQVRRGAEIPVAGTGVSRFVRSYTQQKCVKWTEQISTLLT